MTSRGEGVHASRRVHMSRTRAREFRGRACGAARGAVSFVADTENGIAQTSRHDTVLAQSLISHARLRRPAVISRETSHVRTTSWILP